MDIVKRSRSEFFVPLGALTRQAEDGAAGPERRGNSYGREATQRKISIAPNAPHTEHIRATSVRLSNQTAAGVIISARFDDGEAVEMPLGETFSPGGLFHRVEFTATAATAATIQFGFST